MKSFDPHDPYDGHSGTPSPPSREEHAERDRIARQRETFSLAREIFARRGGEPGFALQAADGFFLAAKTYFAEQPEPGEDGQ